MNLNLDRFEEAHAMKMEVLKKETEENQKYLAERDDMILKKLQPLFLKHNNEIQALEKVLEKEKCELENSQEKEFDQYIKFYTQILIALLEQRKSLKICNSV